MVDLFEIKTTNFSFGFRIFGRCKNPKNKSSDKSVYIVGRSSPCNSESCPIVIKE
ncbi:hypothetical protein KKH23_09140 [Patescibacteria group bacterium]|nr:hypothetical protein [Patescibacteria group bacterium]